MMSINDLRRQNARRRQQDVLGLRADGAAPASAVLGGLTPGQQAGRAESFVDVGRAIEEEQPFPAGTFGGDLSAGAFVAAAGLRDQIEGRDTPSSFANQTFASHGQVGYKTIPPDRPRSAEEMRAENVSADLDRAREEFDRRPGETIEQAALRQAIFAGELTPEGRSPQSAEVRASVQRRQLRELKQDVKINLLRAAAEGKPLGKKERSFVQRILAEREPDEPTSLGAAGRARRGWRRVSTERGQPIIANDRVVGRRGSRGGYDWGSKSYRVPKAADPIVEKVGTGVRLFVNDKEIARGQAFAPFVKDGQFFMPDDDDERGFVSFDVKRKDTGFKAIGKEITIEDDGTFENKGKDVIVQHGIQDGKRVVVLIGLAPEESYTLGKDQERFRGDELIAKGPEGKPKAVLTKREDGSIWVTRDGKKESVIPPVDRRETPADFESRRAKNQEVFNKFDTEPDITATTLGTFGKEKRGIIINPSLGKFLILGKANPNVAGGRAPIFQRGFRKDSNTFVKQTLVGYLGTPADKAAERDAQLDAINKRTAAGAPAPATGAAAPEKPTTEAPTPEAAAETPPARAELTGKAKRLQELVTTNRLNQDEIDIINNTIAGAVDPDKARDRFIATLEKGK